MTRIEKMENYGNKIEELVKELDVLCPEHPYYLRYKNAYLKEKEKFEKNEAAGNRNNLTINVDRYERYLAIFQMLHSKFKFG